MNLNMPPLFLLSGQEWTWVAASYCVGCLTGGYYWVRWFTGRDIRQLGSGSVGARNVGRASGALGFLATLCWDALKGALVVGGALHFQLSPTAVLLSMLAVVAGHIWPVQLRFHGGKGIATSLGALAACNPFILACQLAVFLPAMVVLRSFTLSGLLAFAVAPLVMFLRAMDPIEITAASLLALLTLVAHRKNVRDEINALLPGHARHPDKESPAHRRK
jgi:glycerol-3-phosphate acyltransferase PlsY